MRTIGNYGFQTKTALSFEEAIARATELLKEEGFGILTEIDVKETFKKKLDIDYKPFRILGACNPPFAYKSLEAVPTVSLLLPCNVVVWDEGTHRVVAAMNPEVMVQIIDNPVVATVAAEVGSRLKKVIDRLEATAPNA